MTKALLLTLSLVLSAGLFAAEGTITVSGTFASTIKNFAVSTATCPNNEDLADCVAQLGTMTFSGSTVSVGADVGEETLSRYFAVRAEGNFIAYAADYLRVLASVSSIVADGSAVATNSASSPVQVRLKHLRFKSGGHSTFGQNYIGALATKIDAGGALVDHAASDLIAGTSTDLLLATNASAQTVWNQSTAGCGVNDKVLMALGAGNKFIVEAVYEVSLGQVATAGAFSANVNMGFQVQNN